MQFVGNVKSISTSDDIYNLIVNDKDGNVINLKTEDLADIKINHLYVFEYDAEENQVRTSYHIKSYKKVTDLEFNEQNKLLRENLKASPLTYEEAKEEITKYISLIENNIIKDITNKLITKYHDEYYIYPAASKMHHAYIGGLAYHSIGMLHLADGFIENYPYLNKDYIYAGIMLHDIGKVIELSGVVQTEYTLKGQLLGHLVLGSQEIEKTAVELGYQDSKEVMLLEHMLISHHGVPQFGSAKKPATAEALVLWYIDTLDSKFRVLGEVLETTEADTYTESIGVLDKQKFYKI